MGKRRTLLECEVIKHTVSPKFRPQPHTYILSPRNRRTSSIPFIGDFSHESSSSSFPRGKSGNAAAADGDFAREPRPHRTCCGHRSGGSFTPLNTKTLAGTWTVGQPLSPFGIGSPSHSRLATCIGRCGRGSVASGLPPAARGRLATSRASMGNKTDNSREGREAAA